MTASNFDARAFRANSPGNTQFASLWRQAGHALLTAKRCNFLCCACSSKPAAGPLSCAFTLVSPLLSRSLAILAESKPITVLDEVIAWTPDHMKW